MTQAADTLKLRQLEPFGIEVRLDSLDHAKAHGDELRRYYRQDGLLVVRGMEKLSQAEQINFCRLFGPVQESSSENFLISNVDPEGMLGKRELLWHNDVPYLPEPYLAGCLHALEVKGDPVGTCFVSGYRGYERLPDDLRRRIEGMKAIHVRERLFDRPTRLTDLIEGDMCTVHDVVRTDPEGRKYLFVNEAWTALIIGLSQEDSDALHAEISRHFYAPGESHEHQWQEGDLVLWDNIALQHARGAASDGVRTLQRVTIAELGYEAQYPHDLRAIYEGLHNDTMLAAN